jgi:hypothetical protein
MPSGTAPRQLRRLSFCKTVCEVLRSHDGRASRVEAPTFLEKANTSAPSARKSATESNATMREKSTNKSSGKLVAPANCRNVTSEHVGTIYAVVGTTSSTSSTEKQDEILAGQKHRESQRRSLADRNRLKGSHKTR